MTDPTTSKDNAYSMSYSVPADTRFLHSVPLLDTTTTSPRITQPTPTVPATEEISHPNLASSAKLHLNQLIRRGKRPESPARMALRGGAEESREAVDGQATGSSGTGFTTITRRNSHGSLRRGSATPSRATSTRSISGSSVRSQSLDHTQDSDSIHSAGSPIASTSNWIPSTPFSPYTSTSDNDYFQGDHSSEGSASVVGSSSPMSCDGQRRHSTDDLSAFDAETPRPRPTSRSLDDLLLLSTPPAYPNTICPREEEGQEGLPDYSCAIHLDRETAIKIEQTEPGVKAQDRSWKWTYLVIHGTTMKIFKYDPEAHPVIEDSVATPPRTHSPSPPSVPSHHFSLKIKHNALLHSFSLQNAQCGLASDYYKDPFVVRVRTEGHQMLFKCGSIDACVQMIETLQAAINVALDLDARPLPTFVTLPRRRRRRPVTPPAVAMYRDSVGI